MKRIVFSIIIAFIIKSCVNPIPPSGGPIDEEPPKMLDSLSKPQHKSTDFDGKKVTFYFDEGIETRGLLNELLITPSVEGKVDFEVDKVKKGLYSLTLSFEELDTNTTYIISLGDGVQDMNEGNVAKNPTIAFSTGPHIDSLEINGKVTDHFSGKPAKDYFVGLYVVTDTLDPLEHKPQYLTYTKDDGSYHFEHIKKRKYYLQVFKDENKNKIFDYKTEKGSFVKQNFMLKEDTVIDLTTFLSQDTTTKINTIKKQYKESLSKVMLNKKIAKLTDTLENVYSREGDIYVYHQDSIRSISFMGYDSLYNSFKIDTSLAAIKVDKKGSIKLEKPDYQYFKTLKGKIFVDKPFFKLDHSYILYATNNDTIPVDSSHVQLKTSCDTIYFSQTEHLRDTISLIFDSLAVTDSFERANKPKTFKFTKKDKEEFGTLSGEVRTSEEHYILQCLDKSGKVVQEKKNPEKFEFNYLKPDTYTLRLLIDENGNGIHEKGSVLINRYPEPVYIHEKEFALKANWIINNELIEYNFIEEDTTNQTEN